MITAAYLPDEIGPLISTSRPPSLEPDPSDAESQVDEIIWQSTPPDALPNASVLIASYKLGERVNLIYNVRYSTKKNWPTISDDFEIPRADRPRSGHLAPLSSVAIPTRESLKELLHPLLKDGDRLTHMEDRPPKPSEPPVSISVAGQPPSEVDLGKFYDSGCG